MNMHRILTVLLLAATLGACGGDGPADPTGPNGPNGPNNPLSGVMKATIDGSPWASPANFTTATYDAASRTYVIVGVEQGPAARALLLTLGSVDGPGTYSLPSALPFRYANTTSGAQVWETNAGTSGSVVVTVATPTRIAGTFSFTARPTSANPATNTINVTNGSFDVTIQNQ